MQVYCKQTQNGSDKNSSTIEWKLSVIGRSEWIDTGPTELVIGGKTVCSIEFKPWEYGKFPVAQGSTRGSIEIPHNSDGTKKITVKLSTAIYYHAVNEYVEEWELDPIPRYATSEHSLKSKTEASVTINWASDKTIDYLWYSINNGSSWVSVGERNAKSGTYTINGLTVNKTYKIKTRVRSKESQLTTDSKTLEVTTYDLPHCIETPDFVIGEKVTLKFYNPLRHKISFKIIANGVKLTNEAWTTMLDTFSVPAGATIVETQLYDSIPNAQYGTYKVEVTYANAVRTYGNGNKYYIDKSKCEPTFTDFTYKDTNTKVTAVTGNNQALVKGLSTLSVEISTANKMVAKNKATPDYYSASIDTLSNTGKYSESSAVTIPLGVVSSDGVKRLSVRAYDSRKIPKLAHKDVTVYKYSKPKINASATRLNNFEAQTTLKISGSYEKLTIGGADKNTIKTVQYRYRATGGTWGNWVTLTPTLSAGSFTCANVTLSLDKTKAFEIEVKVTDNFGDLTTSTETITVNIGQAILFVSTNKKTCYINNNEIATQSFVSDAIKALFPTGSSITNALYPVGAVVCMSTNKNPSSMYGGTWTLIDKGFKAYSAYIPSMFTAGTNVTADTVYLSRGGNTIRIRLSIVVNASLSDTGMSLGTLNWSTVGVTGLHAGIIEQLSYRDGANGGIVYSIFHESGEIQQVDVFDATPLASGSTFYLDFTFVSDYTRMLDSVCDKFYWKRTA